MEGAWPLRSGRHNAHLERDPYDHYGGGVKKAPKGIVPVIAIDRTSAQPLYRQVDLVPRFAGVREAMDIFAPTLPQAVLADFLHQGHFARHLRRMRQLYRERRSALVAAIRSELGGSLQVMGEQAGVHLVATLSNKASDRQISSRAARQGLWAMPLSSCYLGPAKRQGLVLGYGGTDVAAMPEAVGRLRRVLRAS
jgi:GntR family transcriptional regulator/MocR family aminotransferase